jgi:hypothetical protein
MAHSAPVNGIQNRGDYQRWQMAARALLLFMKAHDPRVMDAWQDWMISQRIAVWALRLKRERDAGHITDETLTGLCAAIQRHDDPRDLESFTGLVHDTIGMPYTWVPVVLRIEFEEWAAMAIGLPIDRHQLFTVPPPADWPIGRAPRAHGADIARNVSWLYQVRYSSPEARWSIKALAKAWDAEHRAGQLHAGSSKMVREGITQAHTLLGLARRIDAVGVG